MGYMHINNLYKDQDILLFKECYALEKIHGTSAHIKYNGEHLSLYAGGVKHDKFVAIFQEELLDLFKLHYGHLEVTVFGEAYGGKCQKMGDTYGPHLRFVVFDVKIDNMWLSVPAAEKKQP